MNRANSSLSSPSPSAMEAAQAAAAHRPSWTLVAEREADGAAHGSKQPRPLNQDRSSSAMAAHRAIFADQSGSSLAQGFRREARTALGFDFSSVRIHSAGKASETARNLGATAFALGSDIAFAPGQFRPATPGGRALLHHELAHVAQTSGQPAALLMQVPGTSTTPVTPAFSVVQADYVALVTQAITLMQGRLVTSHTISADIAPILTAMLAQVQWRDSAGALSGGGSTSQTLPGGAQPVTLTLVLDDAASSLLSGQFVSSGTTGTMTLFVRGNATAEDIAQTLYHEALHMTRWHLAQGGASATIGTGTGGSDTRRALTLSRFATQIASIRAFLGSLATSVNASRGGGSVSASDLDRVANELMEEVQVRAETEVFRQFLSLDSQVGRLGTMIIPPNESVELSQATVDRYVFDFSRVFQPGDRANLTSTDRDTLRMLTEAMQGFFRHQVRQQFSIAAHATRPSRIAPDIGPSPMRRSFIPELLRSAEEIP